MNRLSLFLLFLFLAVPAAAQPEVRLYAHAGPTVPLQPTVFGDFWKTGFHLGGGAGLILFGDWEVVLSATYNRMTLDAKRFIAEGEAFGVQLDVEGGAFVIASGSIRLKYNLEAGRWFAPYLVAGLGLHAQSIKRLTIQEAGGGTSFILPAAEVADETSPALELGAGLGYPLAQRVTAFVEPNYSLVFGEGDRRHYLPIKFGMVFLLGGAP